METNRLPENVYERVVVPLDGSAEAERVIPYVDALAKGLGAQVFLLHAMPATGTIIPPAASAVPAGGPYVDAGDMLAAQRREADEMVAYLDALAGRLGGAGLIVEYDLDEGSPARVIVDYARNNRASLIVMTTHGGGVPEESEVGETAGAVLRDAPCPVLLVPAQERP